MQRSRSQASAGLFLDCQDEALSPVQKFKYEKAVQQYEAASKKIETYKSKNVSITYVNAGDSQDAGKLENKPVEILPKSSRNKKSQKAPKASGKNASVASDSSATNRRRRSAAMAARLTISDIATKVLHINPGETAKSRTENDDPNYINTSPEMVLESGRSKITVASVAKRGRPRLADKPRPAEKTAATKQKKALETDASAVENLKVPIHEYYYGQAAGSLTYREEKGQFKFKCWYCHKMLYNNVRLMAHLQGHLDTERQQRLDLIDITQCRVCYKQFDTPFEMQSHMERVHQNNPDVLLCRICEKDLDSPQALVGHMRGVHGVCEMPYACQLCDFRSSVYSDIMDHFKKRHDSSKFLMCQFCLKVQEVKFHSTGEFGLTLPFYQHLQKHQARGQKKCSACKLLFFTSVDMKTHKKQDHQPNAHVSPVTACHKSLSASDKTLVTMPSVKTLLDKMQHPPYSLSSTEGSLCKECGKEFNTKHFVFFTECPICTFGTMCAASFSKHFQEFHSGNPILRQKNIPRDRNLDRAFHCFCGFETKKGNSIATHLLLCSRRTAFTHVPEQRYFEYDDEEEEFNPFGPYEEEVDDSEAGLPQVPSLFGALGLVRKKTSKNGAPSPATVQLATDIMQEIINKVAPKEDIQESMCSESVGGGGAGPECEEMDVEHHEDSPVVQGITTEMETSHLLSKSAENVNELNQEEPQNIKEAGIEETADSAESATLDQEISRQEGSEQMETDWLNMENFSLVSATDKQQNDRFKDRAISSASSQHDESIPATPASALSETAEESEYTSHGSKESAMEVDSTGLSGEKFEGLYTGVEGLTEGLPICDDTSPEGKGEFTASAAETTSQPDELSPSVSSSQSGINANINDLFTKQIQKSTLVSGEYELPQHDAVETNVSKIAVSSSDFTESLPLEPEKTASYNEYPSLFEKAQPSEHDVPNTSQQVLPEINTDTGNLMSDYLADDISKWSDEQLFDSGSAAEKNSLPQEFTYDKTEDSVHASQVETVDSTDKQQNDVDSTTVVSSVAESVHSTHHEQEYGSSELSSSRRSRSKSKDRSKSRERRRSRDRSRSRERRRSRDRHTRDRSRSRGRRDRDRSRDRHRHRSRSSDRHSRHQRDRNHHSKRSRSRSRDRKRSRSRDRHRDSYKSRNRSRSRDRHHSYR